MEGVWAIILAAGESKRMGFPKMLLPFNGSTMIENVIRNVKSSNIDNLVVVLGAGSQKLTKLIGRLNVNCCYNNNFKEGMLSSVLCGIRNLPSDYRAAMVFQGDQPLIAPGSINIVIEAYKSSGKGIIIPVFEKKRGHPVLIDRKLRNEILKLDPAEGLRSLAYKFPGDVLEVNTDDPGILRDFDTFDEYKKEIIKIH
ncbi:MAG: nucleotidyltransferase family protein [Bacteroidetes bacterium]|nr:MAG: nucleotidyltransferase family protein [Bacteroidota bacterium]